jgi:hypothetical protein
MKIHDLAKLEEAYEIYGTPKKDGIFVAVRPDGYVGMAGMLGRLDAFGWSLISRDVCHG